LVLRFTKEEKGQVEAIDTLFFAALVSICAVLIATYGVGSYHQDLHMQALQHRYTSDFSQSFIMTSRYISAGEGDIAYTIGPQITGDDSVFYSFSNLVNKSIGASPLDRKVKGSILDIIAEDLYLGVAIHKDGEAYPLNSWFLTSQFHEEVNGFVVKNLDFLSGGTFYYRLEASYYPYDGVDFIYSEAVYTNTQALPNSSVYVTEVIVAIPAVSQDKGGIDKIAEFSEKLDNMTDSILPTEIINSSGDKVPFSKEVGEVNDILQNVSENEMKKTGKVVIKIWPKVGGEDTGRVL